MRPAIGVDLLGGDHSPVKIFSEIMHSLGNFLEPISLVFFVTEDIYSQIKLESFHLPSHIKIEYEIVDAIIHMEDDPLIAVRKKNNSSLVVGLKQVTKRSIDALITVGNTGALITAAHLHCRRLPGIDRTALLAKIPTKNNELALVDVGAHVACTSDQLLQFANLGIAYYRAKNKGHIHLGLLNIGSEKIKGPQEIRRVYEKLTSHYEKLNNIHFIGNIESNELFSGNVQLAITDGFTGNMVLKMAEGLSSFFFKEVLSELPDEEKVKIKQKWSRFFGYQNHPGAYLLGNDAIIMKCHGRSMGKELYLSIVECFGLVKKDFLHTFKKHLLETTNYSIRMDR